MKTTPLKLAVLALTVTLTHPVISLAGETETAIGPAENTIGVASIATGQSAEASGYAAIATGYHAEASGHSSIAQGENSKAYGNYSVVIGSFSATENTNTVAIGNRSIADRDNTFSVGKKNAERQITNVAAGTANTDAVNVSQVNNAKEEAISIANIYTDSHFKPFTTDTGNRINQLDNKIDGVEKQANAGIAGVTAIASIPYSTSENFSFGMGVGHYKNAQAIAAGAQYKIADNANVRLNIAWDNTDNASVGAGLAIGW